MNLILQIPTVILSSILVPLMFSYIAYQANKQERKTCFNKDFFKTKFPKSIVIFFLLFGIIVILGFIITSVILGISEELKVHRFIILIICGLLFSGIGFLGLFHSLLTYEIVLNDKIIVKRFPGKSKEIMYYQIHYYVDSYGQLKVFDKNNIPILFVGDNRIGLNNLIGKLDSKFITRLSEPIKVNINDETPEYKSYKKIIKYKNKKYIFIFFSIGCLFLSLLVFLNSFEQKEGIMEIYYTSIIFTIISILLFIFFVYYHKEQKRCCNYFVNKNH
jgi:MFS family permease